MKKYINFPLLACLMLTAIVFCCTPASVQAFQWINDQAAESTTLVGSDTVSAVAVDSMVTRVLNGGSFEYTYSYAVTYTEGSGNALHIIGVANEVGQLYYDSSNSGASVAFTNPVFNPVYAASDIEWTYGELLRNSTCSFSYKSRYAPDEILAYAYAINGGEAAEGYVIGMGSMIPEPASLLALSVGFVGLLPKLLRRK